MNNEIMNWDKLKLVLPTETFNHICHGYGCKLSSWEDATDVVKISDYIYNLLMKIRLPRNSTPVDDLPDEAQDVDLFIAIVDNDQYLVNTEGFEYCRYVAKVEVE